MGYRLLRRMPAPGKLIFYFSILCTFGLCGCAPRIEGKYQLKRMKDNLVVLPPPYWKQALNKPIKVQFSTPENSTNAKAHHCSISSGLYRLSSSGQHPLSKWTATLPSLASWQLAISNVSFPQEIDHFIDAIDRLELDSCLPSAAGTVKEQAIRENVQC